MRLAGLLVFLMIVAAAEAARVQDMRPLMGTAVELIAEDRKSVV